MILGLKLLDENMQSCNGGSFQWELDKWYEIEGEINICESGFHFTLLPGIWEGVRLFICETPKVLDEQIDESVCRKIRLVKELSLEERESYEKTILSASEIYNKTIVSFADKNFVRKVYEESESSAWKIFEKSLQKTLKELVK